MQNKLYNNNYLCKRKKKKKKTVYCRNNIRLYRFVLNNIVFDLQLLFIKILLSFCFGNNKK